jgi:hypothetical protein
MAVAADAAAAPGVDEPASVTSARAAPGNVVAVTANGFGRGGTLMGADFQAAPATVGSRLRALPLCFPGLGFGVAADAPWATMVRPESPTTAAVRTARFRYQRRLGTGFRRARDGKVASNAAPRVDVALRPLRKIADR